MLNTSPLNTSPLVGSSSATTATQGILTINGLCVSEGAYSLIDITDSPASKVSSYDIPQNHGKGFLSYFNRGRSFSITVFITGTDKNDFIKNLDAFRKACYTKNSVAEWKYDDEIRTTEVLCTSSPQTFKHYNINYMQVTVNFTILKPFWTKLSKQSTSIFAQTSSFKEEISNLGTAQSDMVVYILFQNTNTTQVKLKVWENEIIIDHTFANNDILKIDGVNKRVYVWVNLVDYSGIFPFMDPGTNFFDFTINWTFLADVLVLNDKNYV